MEDIRTKSENTTPRQRAAAQIPKEAMRQLWLRSKEKGRTEIESTADGQQGGQYSEANQTGEKVSDALQSVGKSSAKVAVHKGRELAKKRAGQRHMEQSVERQEQTGQQSFSELQAPDGGQVSSNLTEPRECSVPSGKENPSANHSRISDSAKQTSSKFEPPPAPCRQSRSPNKKPSRWPNGHGRLPRTLPSRHARQLRPCARQFGISWRRCTR